MATKKKPTTAKTIAAKTTTRPTAKARIEELNNLVHDLEFKVNHLNTNNKDLRLETERLVTTASLVQLQAEENKTRLEIITRIILDRLDGDGVNDLEGLSGKIGWWFVVRNMFNIASMIKEIIAVIKK